MKSLPQFSVENPVLVGVVMASILIGGVYAAFTLVREMFPESRPNQVLISTLYPGATPSEVEKGVAMRLEEAIKDVEHIEKVETFISEGACTLAVTLTFEADDLDQAVNDFKAAIDTIPRDELPEDAEEIRVRRAEPRLPVISVALFGDVNEGALKAAGQKLRDELLLLPGLSDVVLTGTRKAELSVEVQPEKLIEYGLSLQDVSAAIRHSNLDLPAGQVRTANENIALRTLGETDQAETIAETIVRSDATGEMVRVRDLAAVIDGFEDSDVRGRFNGKPAVDLTVYKTGDQDAIDIAEKVQAFVLGKQRRPLPTDLATRLKNALGVRTAAQRIHEQAWNDAVPESLELMTHTNLARYIESRLDLLKRNGTWGLGLVFLSLLMFLNWRVAFWVMMGLVLSVCGAVMLMSALGETLNLISMFGLIIVLGLIVDDAIIVGENIYVRVERGEDSKQAAIEGTREVTWPVVIAVLTTIAAFLPLIFVKGRIGDFMGVLPIVVMCALSVSLIESLSILPCHLAKALRAGAGGAPARSPRSGWWGRVLSLREKQRHLTGVLFSERYERFLRLATHYRYVTFAAVIAVTFVTLGLIAGRHVPLVLIQEMDSETLLVDLDMPVGTPIDQTDDAMRIIEAATEPYRKSGEMLSVYSLVGAQISATQFGTAVLFRAHLGQAIIELDTVDHRERSSAQIIAELREKTTGIPGVNSLKYHPMQGGPQGIDIEIEVTGRRFDDVRAAADAIKAQLAKKQGVNDIADDHEQGRRELRIELLESARPLNMTTRALATEIRGAFYGLTARTLQREREDVDIRVRFPEQRRRHIAELESMRIVTPDGAVVPLCELARVTETRGAAAIHRIDQRRAIVVSADIDQGRTTSDAVTAEMRPVLRELERRYPGLRIDFAGSKAEFAKSFGSLRKDFLAAVLFIYVMLAGLFRSYLQPLVVLIAVPFGLNGAVFGHLLMGYPLTILSIIGLVALTGIVVNDSLILVNFINKEIAAGTPREQAVISAGRRRLRPILLTSLTTVLGLAPMLTETSFQARFLIPMAISISFGLAFATVLTLVVVPSAFLILYDLKSVAYRLLHGSAPPLPAGPAS